MEHILTLLEKYGLSDRHARVYLYLLEKMEDTVLEISRSLGIPRTTTYSILNELKQQSLVSSFRKNKTQYWVSESIQQFPLILEQKKIVLDELLPLLQQVGHLSKQKGSSVRLFTGKEGLKIVWEDIISYLESKKPQFVFAISHTDLYSVLPKYFPQWIERRRKSKVFAKLIVHHGHQHLRSDSGQEVRAMPEKYVFTGDLTIYGDKVALFIFNKDKLESLIIDSPVFTQMIKGLFDFTWDSLGEKSKI